MNQCFALIYESLFYNPEYQYVFDTIYNQEGYSQLGWSIILSSLVVWLIFYVLISNPYYTKRHWGWCFYLIQGSIAAVICWIILRRIVDADINPDDETLKAYLTFLQIKMSIANFFLTWIIGILFVWILKHFSTHNIHLP